MEELEEKEYAIDYIIENQIDKTAYGFVYITTNIIDEHKYIGQKKFNKGWKTYLGSGLLFKKALNKYGKENFDRRIVVIAHSPEELNNLEIQFIKYYNAVQSHNYYNIASGGSIIQSGEKNHMYGKCGKLNPFYNRIKINCEICGKEKEITLSEYNNYTHHYCSKECHAKGNSIFYSGENSPLFNQITIKCSYCNKEMQRPLSLINDVNYCSSKCKSEHCKQKMKGEGNPNYGNGEKIRGKNNGRARSVICLTTKEKFDTAKEGADKYNIKQKGNITRVCKRELNYAGKHPITKEPLKWIYYEDYIKQNKNVG